MANIVIKKKVQLDFLGEEYKDDYLVFKAIPIKDYEKIVEDVEKLADNNKQSFKYMKEVIPKYFLSGSFGGEDVTKENLEDFDQETYLNIFQRITGQVQNANLPVA